MRRKLLSTYMLILLATATVSCGSTEASDSVPLSSKPDVSGSIESVSSAETAQKGSRDNTIKCLIPVADGTSTIGNELVTVDISHSSDGYICVTYTGDATRTRIIITTPQNLSYTYDLTKNKCDAFPLTGENGPYNVGIYEQISGNDYSVLFKEDFNVSISNEFSPYLHPNQYVNYDQNTKAVILASELALPANSDLDVIQSVYNYVITNITYDYDKADTVESTYIPDVDNTLSSGKGICFDFASLMASMLRSQGIPTRLEIGYAGDVYHAWISTYIEDVGWVNGIIEFDGKDWKLMDPTFATTTSEKKLKNYIEEGDNYITKFMY